MNPTVSVARILTARGHTVAWMTHPEIVGPVLPPGAEILDAGFVPADARVNTIESSRRLRGLASIEFLWERVLLPLARVMLPRVIEAVDAWRPDVLIADQQALAGAIAGRLTGVPWVTSCTTPSWGLVDPFEQLPKVKAWIDDQVAALEVEAGLTPIPLPDLSRRLILIFSTEALAGPVQSPGPYLFLGPAIAERPAAIDFPWDELGARPRVFASLGTVSAVDGREFYAALVEGLRDFDGQVVLAAPPELVPDAPPHFLVRRRVPQLALLEHVDAVITHGGNNTVCESLSHGLPLVVAPIRDDQPLIADQVVRAGAGLRIRYGRRVSATELRAATLRVLEEPAFRENATRIGASFRAAGGAEAAADALEREAAGAHALSGTRTQNQRLKRPML